MTHDNDLASIGAALIEEALQAGLPDDKTEHISFHAPEASVEAAKRESDLPSITEPGLFAALAILARPDPVAAVMRQTRGSLGPSHKLEY
jgi:hypothetical protein